MSVTTDVDDDVPGDPDGSGSDATPAGVPTPAHLALRGVVAVVVIVAANLLVRAIGARIVPSIDLVYSLRWSSVAYSTAFSVVGLALIYGAMTRLMERPERGFIILLFGLFLGSFLPVGLFLPASPDATVGVMVYVVYAHTQTAVLAGVLLMDPLWERLDVATG